MAGVRGRRSSVTCEAVTDAYGEGIPPGVQSPVRYLVGQVGRRK